MDQQLVTKPMISIRDDASVCEAARLMTDSGIGAVGVLDRQKRFAGIFTERDLTQLVAVGTDLETTRMSEVVNDFPVVIEGPVSGDVAAERMRRARVRHLVVREYGDYRIVSLRDLNLPVDARTGGILDELPHIAGDGLCAADVMTCPGVVCDQEAFIEEIAEILSDREISGMPVVDGSQTLVGVISERDVAHALGGSLVRLAIRRGSGPFLRRTAHVPGATKARDIMTTPPLTATPETSLADLAEAMVLNGINRIPIVHGDRLVGIVTRGDILRAIAHPAAARRIDLGEPAIVVGAHGSARPEPFTAPNAFLG
ncbi:MAG TPA: CBS domain-containing protein [Actinomycetota bacterium]|nr:CBS domain-containing protein [Actinomycetota bacterium]